MTERCKRNPCCGDYLDCKPPPQFKPREGYEAYRERTAPAPAPVDAAGLVARLVKPLEWVSRGRYDQSAEGITTYYFIEYREPASGSTWSWHAAGARPTYAQSKAEAKAAAQADYTARILSALDASALAAAAEREHLLQAKLDRAKDDLARCCEERAAAAEREAALVLAAEANKQAAKEMEAMKDEALRAERAAEARVTAAEAEERERCAQIVERFSEAALKCERCGDIRHTYAPGGCSGEAAFRASDEFRRMTLTDSVYDAIRYFEKHLCNPTEITIQDLPGIIAAAIRKETTA